MKEVKTYECPCCHGEGTIIGDWDAYNQMAPAGFSKRLQKINERLAERAFVKCGRCYGRGVVYDYVEGRCPHERPINKG